MIVSRLYVVLLLLLWQEQMQRIQMTLFTMVPRSGPLELIGIPEGPRGHLATTLTEWITAGQHQDVAGSMMVNTVGNFLNFVVVYQVQKTELHRRIGLQQVPSILRFCATCKNNRTLMIKGISLSLYIYIYTYTRFL